MGQEGDFWDAVNVLYVSIRMVVTGVLSHIHQTIYLIFVYFVCVIINFKTGGGTSLVVQWVRLYTPNAGGLGLIPGQGIRSRMHATTKKFACCN